MARISGIIAFQTKKSNLERDLRKETDIENELQREIYKKVLKHRAIPLRGSLYCSQFL